jgi:hypothetical protein
VTSDTWTTASLSQARAHLAATSVADRYALFAGGYNMSEPSNVVDIFDSLSGTWRTTTLSQARCSLAATSLCNLAFFGGGQIHLEACNDVDIFNATTQTWSTTTLSQARYWLAATSTRNKVIFAGGLSDGKASDVVDIFECSNAEKLMIRRSLKRQRNDIEVHKYWRKETARLERSVVGLSKAVRTLKTNVHQSVCSLEDKYKKMDEELFAVKSLVKKLEFNFTSLENLKETKKILDGLIDEKEKNANEVIAMKCVVCCNSPPCILFCTCRHLCACENCAETLTACPLCRDPSEKIKVFTP